MSCHLAMCGLDCGACDAYLATQAEDAGAKERIAARWREEYGVSEIDADHVTCDGCLTGERHGGYCGACAVRACGLGHEVRNCAHCAEYEGCGALGQFFAQFPGGAEASPARLNLERLRRMLESEQGS